MENNVNNSMKSNVIAIGGLKGSGKSTVGNHLVERCGLKPLAFADPIKQMVKLAFPKVTDEQLWGPSDKREELLLDYPVSVCPFCGSDTVLSSYVTKHETTPLWCTTCNQTFPPFLTARVLCQTLGSEWGRRMHEDVWIDRAFDTVNASPDASFVVTDCRFEHQAVLERGGITMLLTRGMRRLVRTPEARYVRDAFAPADLAAAMSHTSESAILDSQLSDWTIVLDNSSLSLEATLELVNQFANGLGLDVNHS